MTREEAKIKFRDELPVVARSLAMPTTGNREQDEAHIHDVALSTCMITAGFCPNGHGKMDKDIKVATKSKTSRCPVCEFSCIGYADPEELL